MTKDRLIGEISKDGMVIRVMKVVGSSAYKFDAVGKESLPLAVDLALIQTQKGKPTVDNLLNRGRNA